MTEAIEPHALESLRLRVGEWIERARDAVLSFLNPHDGSFLRDSRTDASRHNSTTTARCYMALAYADRCISRDERGAEWREHFRKYLDALALVWGEGAHVDISLSGQPTPMNNFEVAHIPDLVFVADYQNRFHGSRFANPHFASAVLIPKLQQQFERATVSASPSKQLPMDQGDISDHFSQHFFVNLHAARGLAILGVGQPRFVDATMDAVGRYCAEQCFYGLRGPGYRLDGIQLTLAAVYYVLYSKIVDSDLCDAVIDSVALRQQEGGNWAATHPLFRRDGKPWHITSHEVALCLTWLYFVPHISDKSRSKLLEMMARYFERWVTQTFVPGVRAGDRYLSGWFDDHHIEEDYVVGWATSIVCHFLANYYWVLSDHINRSVIESLGLEASARHYRIDKTAPPVYRREYPVGTNFPLWFDLAPYAWDRRTEAEVAQAIQKRWTDPSSGQQHSKEFASKIVGPILRSPGRLPAEARCAGMLTGPPGTRKTTLVRCIADALGWPMVSVPASVLLARGWDAMEPRASEVFRQLGYLTQCVVFFDEFEEFFRARQVLEKSTEAVQPHALPPLDNRTLAAFMTSAMLPRMQDLHDRGRSLIFLATNFPTTIDEAVRRAGRFDFALEISHPSVQTVRQYVQDRTSGIRRELLANLNEAQMNRVETAVLSAITNVEDEVIPFKNVEDALRQAARHERDGREAAVLEKSALEILKRGEQILAPNLRDLV